MNSSSATRALLGSRPRLLTGRSFSRRRAAKDPHKTRVASFRSVVWGYWERNGRHDLPWRKTKDPYRILVSEMMLQQTQVRRVIGKYKEFLKAFPSVKKLARAPLAEVLRVWSGLGYNRRAKYLHDAAIKNLKEPLAGVGPYTRAAVRVFAHNEPDILLETNIRTAFIHHFLIRKRDTIIYDSKLIPLARKAAEGQDPRKWHWALMDYGAYLKRSGVRNNHRSAHYVRQSKFEGSLRQIRGAILRELEQGPSLLKGLKFKSSKIQSALASLARDGLIVKVRPRRIGPGPKKRRWRIA